MINGAVLLLYLGQ